MNSPLRKKLVILYVKVCSRSSLPETSDMRKIVGLVFPALLFSQLSFSQWLNGRVLNEAGGAAVKVNVSFKNKVNSVTTSPDGHFKILAGKLPDTLVFAAPGYEPYKVVVTEKNLKDPDFEVVLLNRREMYAKDMAMAEVVVTSMGAKRKPKELGYATTTISGDALLGKASGLTVYSGSGSSEKMALRGYSSAPAPSPIDDKRFYLGDTNIITRSNTELRSRLLTAGEVNDFRKWKMWEEYSETEFKSMSRFWGMWTHTRYSVQLTDKKFNAIVNEPVYLISKSTRDTIWKSYTDNTGKAELWAGFLADSADRAGYYISDRSGNSLYGPSAFSNGVNLLVADRGCQVTNDVDIAFVVDATGSMGDEIEFLKLELEDVIRKTMDKYKSLSWKAASVFYRDRSDEYVTKKVGFNEDLLKAINFIKLQRAGGGGDYPEAVDEALATALDSLQWNKNARARLLFLVLDAPPHNEAKERIQQLVVRAAAMGIRIIPVACSGTDKSTEFLLRSMALATNGTYTFLTNHSGVGNSHIEPTTDKYEVELLNDLLQRVIGQFVYAKDCSVAGSDTVQQEVIRQPENILAVKIYPNPTSGVFAIETKKDIKEIFITDFTGKILMRLNAGDRKGKWQVDISPYPAGVYLVKYITEDNKWGAEKIVLVR